MFSAKDFADIGLLVTRKYVPIHEWPAEMEGRNYLVQARIWWNIPSQPI